MNKIGKRGLSLALALVMVLALLPVTASAADTTVTTYGDLQTEAALASSTYDTIKLGGDITDGAAQLTIGRDLTLDLNGYNLTIELLDATGQTSNGIKLADDVTLTIVDSQYNASTSTNKLTVTNNSTDSSTGCGAAINTSDGTLIIQSGMVEATGGIGGGAGIGGGSNGGAGGIITISGGTVTANGGGYGAGIGGGADGAGGTITISGGTVTANGGFKGGAGIGGGIFGAGGTITISGDAEVTATGGDGYSAGGSDAFSGGAGIGSGGCYYDGTFALGDSAASGDITISDSATVTATGGAGAGTSVFGHAGAGIGSGGGAGTGSAGGLGTVSIADTATVTATGGAAATGANAGAGVGRGGDTNGTGVEYLDYFEVSTATQLADALSRMLDNTTIKLLANIDYDTGILIENKTVTFALNGHTLNVVCSDTDVTNDGDALEVYGGEVILTGAGEFNVTSTVIGGAGVYAHDGAKVTVTNAACNAVVSNGESYGSYGVYADDAEVEVTGNVSATTTYGDCYGVYADYSAIVTVGGNITAESTGNDSFCDGICAFGSSTVTVGGNVTAKGAFCIGVEVAFFEVAATDVEITIDGIITVSTSASPGGWAKYISFNETEVQKSENKATTTKAGYLEYNDSAVNPDYTNYVWVKDATSPNPISPSTATLTVEGVDETGKVIYTKTESATVGQTKTVKAPEIDGYTLNDDAEKSVTIKSGENKVTFKYTTDKKYPVLEREEHIKYLNGYPDGTVGADKNITRAEVAAIFYRLIVADDKDAPLTASFSDVSGNAWYYQAVAYLEKYGIIEGYADGTFKPDAAITRAEFAAIASRFDKLETNAPNKFSDVSDTYWAAGYINSAAAKGWVTGYTDGTFRPNEYITRAEVVTLVNRMLNRKIELQDIPEGANIYSDIDSNHWAYCDIIEASVEHDYTRKAGGSELWK